MATPSPRGSARRDQRVRPSALSTARRQQAIDALTPRQREVATLVAEAIPPVAHELVISRYMAETHVKHIMKRLGWNPRTELTVWASQHGLTGRE